MDLLSAPISRGKEFMKNVELLDILIVDDEYDLAEGLSKLLKAEGYLVETANNAKEAFEIFSRKSISLILCDISMPEIDGLDFFSQLRALGKSQAFVMLTAHSESDRIIRALKLGAIDYMVKPFEIENLLKKCAMWVDLGRRLTFTAQSADSSSQVFNEGRFIHQLRANLDRLDAK